LLSHYDIVKEAAEAGDDATLTNQCNLMQDYLANKYVHGSKTHKASFDMKQKFTRGMNLAKWFDARFVDISQHKGGAELRYFLGEKIFVHPDLRLPPSQWIMDIAKSRSSPEDTDSFMYKSFLHAGVLSRSADILRSMSASTGHPAAQRPPPPADSHPSTWAVNEPLEVLDHRLPQEGEEHLVGVWTTGHFFYGYDEDRGIRVVSPELGTVTWVAHDRVRPVRRPAFTTPAQEGADADEHGGSDDESSNFSDAESTVRHGGHTRARQDIGLLESGVYDPSRHQPWMAIMIVMRLSKAAQSLNHILAPQLLRIIDDESLREECLIRGNGKFIDMALIMYENEGQSPGLHMIQELNRTDLRYQGPQQLCLAISMRDAALEYADRDTIKVWELLKVLDSAISAERDPEWKRSLRDAASTTFGEATDWHQEEHENKRKNISGRGLWFWLVVVL
jgi:hypothetical protein